MNNIVYQNGINDMPYGWTKKNEWNKKVYIKWRDMLRRVYSEEYHNKKPTYINCTLCLEWRWLSKFTEDFKHIEGYDEEKFLNGKLELDKDIKSNGKIKEYSLNNCILTNKIENGRQARKTDNYDYMKGKNNPMYKKSNKVARYDSNMLLIDIWDNSSVASKSLNIDKASINRCCQFWEMNCNKDEWFKTHKKFPNKSAGKDKNGNKYIWKYYKD